MATFEEIIQDFDTYARTIASRRSEIPEELVKSIVKQIALTRSIDTGRFLRAVDSREESGAEDYNYVIDAARDSTVVYDDIVERGRRTGNPYPAGRFNYLKGIENSNFDVFFDSAFDSSFAR
jgi:hypothetical protein